MVRYIVKKTSPSVVYSGHFHPGFTAYHLFVSLAVGVVISRCSMLMLYVLVITAGL